MPSVTNHQPTQQTQTPESTAEDLAQLLAQLEDADSVAGELEGKVDGILGNLDKLLEVLETKSSDSEATQTKTKTEANSKSCQSHLSDFDKFLIACYLEEARRLPPR